MKIKKGDKITLKRFKELDNVVKETLTDSDLKNEYINKFEGKTFTVSNIIFEKPTYVVEFEEDEDTTFKFATYFKYSLLDAISIPNKKHHFNEEFFDLRDFNDNNTHSFGWALKMLKKGKKVARKGWNGAGMWLELQKPDENSKMTLPYIYIEYPKNPNHHAYPNGSRCPWLGSQTDLLMEDWFEVE